MSEFTDEVVKHCAAELALFRDGKNKEYDKSVYLRVGDYWDSVAKVSEVQGLEGLQREVGHEAAAERRGRGDGCRLEQQSALVRGFHLMGRAGRRRGEQFQLWSVACRVHREGAEGSR